MLQNTSKDLDITQILLIRNSPMFSKSLDLFGLRIGLAPAAKEKIQSNQCSGLIFAIEWSEGRLIRL
jgi:hypothetical protein